MTSTAALQKAKALRRQQTEAEQKLWLHLFDFYFKATTMIPIVILRVAKRSRRIQVPNGFRDYARNDGPSQ